MTKYIDEKIESKVLEQLRRLDIPKQAARIYIALLSIGEGGISRLEQETGLHRQIIYNGLAVLEDLGLAKHVITKGRKRFSVQPA